MNLTKIIETFYDFINPKQRKEEGMLNLVLPFIGNMIRDMVIDKASTLAAHHVEEHLDKLPQDVKDALDAAIDGDNSHAHKSLKDLIKG